MRWRAILSHAWVSRNPQFLHGSYQYAPLPSPRSIRLLQLIPSEDRRAVQCRLEIFELDNAPPFCALSYTWGSPLLRLNPTTATSTTRDTTSRRWTSTPNRRKQSTVHGDSNSGIPKSARWHSIMCDGRIIKVRSNLKDALSMLAHLTTSPSPAPTYFWIDALCMNQQNILERNAQVAKMADIFNKAQKVIVWLGREDEYTADALTTIERVSAIPKDIWSSIPYTSFYDPTQSSKCPPPNLTCQNWLGFIALINRPWFKRAWVVQEIALARSATVICGKKTFPWEKLSQTLSFIKSSKWYHHLQTEKLRHIKSLQKDPGIYKRMLRSKLSVGVGPGYLNATRLKLSNGNPADPNGMEKLPLRMLLDTHRFSKSTDPRDKVYAFLGLADRRMSPFRSHPDALVPNYNLSVQEVYMETASVLLTTYRNLSSLSHVEDSSQRQISNLPSWVPDYSVDLDPYPLRYRGPSYWRASGTLAWKPNISSLANGELDVTGYRLDTIDQTSVLQNESDDPSASWASAVKLALSLDVYPNPGSYKTVPSRVEVLWRTLITNIYNKIYPAPDRAGSLFIDYILNLQIRHRLTPWSSSDEFQPHSSPLSDSIYPEWRTLLQLEPCDSQFSLENYRKRLGVVVETMFTGTYSPIGLAQLQHEIDQSGGKRRRLFTTKGGYLGTGARSLKGGDEVWILHGAGVPFVLRPLPNGNYRLVGESFVYGVMHGEVQGLSLPRQQITIE